MTNHNNKLWFKLDLLPKQLKDVCYCSVLSIDFNKFIIITDKYGIWEYNRYLKSWNKWKTTASDDCKNNFYRNPDFEVNLNHKGIGLNKEKMQIWIYTKFAEMIMIDIKTHNFKIYKASLDTALNETTITKLKFPHLISIQKNLYIISHDTIHYGSDWGLQHFAWDDKWGLFRFIDYRGSSYNVGIIDLIESTICNYQNKALLFGGINTEHHKKTIYWSEITKQLCDKKNIWNPIPNITFNTKQTSVITTFDQKYLFIVGGFKNFIPTQDIYILQKKDNDEYKIRLSHIQAPFAGKCHIVITAGTSSDELVVSGFIRELFNTPKFVGFLYPPFYIIKIIINWYNTELLHWIQTKHYAIPISHILS